jgi:hypothetical protein
MGEDAGAEETLYCYDGTWREGFVRFKTEDREVALCDFLVTHTYTAIEGSRAMGTQLYRMSGLERRAKSRFPQESCGVQVVDKGGRELPPFMCVARLQSAPHAKRLEVVELLLVWFVDAMNLNVEDTVRAALPEIDWNRATEAAPNW